MWKRLLRKTNTPQVCRTPRLGIGPTLRLCVRGWTASRLPGDRGRAVAVLPTRASGVRPRKHLLIAEHHPGSPYPEFALRACAGFAMDPPYLGLLKGNYGISSMGWFKSYQAAFINTSRFRPIQHVIGFVVLLGYALEYPHLKRACFACACTPLLGAPQRTALRARKPLGQPSRARIELFLCAHSPLLLPCPWQTSSIRGRRRRPWRATESNPSSA